VRPRIICRLLGFLLVFLAGFMATSMLWEIGEDDSKRSLVAYGTGAGLTALAGLGLILVGIRAKVGDLGRREALVIVALGWLLSGVFGGIPFVIDGAIPSPAGAFFEAVSGFTTTGSTVLTDIEVVSRATLWWRALTQWLGGMGIIVLFLAVFPQLGVGAKHMFRNEAPGPIKKSLRPKIRETALVLWLIYLAITAVEAVTLYAVGGMSPFESITHSFCTMATAGFSTRNASIAAFDRASVEMIIAFFMLLAGVNFSLYFSIVRGRLRSVYKDTELRVYLGSILALTLVVALCIAGPHGGLFQGLRYAVFQVISILTTTGFCTDDFNQYPEFCRALLVVLMLVGGMAGSTAGGMKISRILICIKAAYWEVYRAFRPQVVTSVRVGRAPVDPDVVRSVMAFFFLAIIAIVVSTLYMASLGLNLETATTSVVATLFNIGPGLAQVGAVENYAFIPPTGKVLLSFCMILGRLEFYTVLVLLLPDFWRIRGTSW